MCMRTMLLRKKLEFKLLRRKLFSNVSQIFALVTCSGHDFLPYHLCTAVEVPHGSCDITFYPFFCQPGLAFSSLQEHSYLISIRPFLTVFSNWSSFVSVYFPLRTIAAKPLSALLPIAPHYKSHLPSQSFLFSTNPPRFPFLYTSSYGIHYLLYSFSLSISAGFIPPGHNGHQRL